MSALAERARPDVPDGLEGHHTRNFRALAADGASFAVGLTFFEMATVLPVFIAHFTDSALLIGSAVALKNAGYYLPQLPIALGLRQVRQVKGMFLGFALVGRLALLLTVPIALFSTGMDPRLVVALFLGVYAIFSFTEGGASLAWMVVPGKVLVPSVRGRMFGLAQAAGGVASIAAAGIVQLVLGGNRLAFPANFAVLFGLGFLAVAVSFVCIVLVHEPVGRDDQPEDLAAGAAVRELVRDWRLQRVLVAQVLEGRLNLELPFYVIFASARLQRPPEWIAAFMLAQTVGAAGMGLVWGRIAERSGAQRVLHLATVLLVCVPLSALAAGYLGPYGWLALLLTFALAGSALGGTRLAFLTYGLDLSHARNRRQYFGVVNTANAPILLMPLVGGLLLDGGGFEVLFVSGAIAGVLAFLVGLGLPDVRLHPER